MKQAFCDGPLLTFLQYFDYKFQVVQLPTTSEEQSNTGLTTRLNLSDIQEWIRSIPPGDMMGDTISSVWLSSIKVVLTQPHALYPDIKVVLFAWLRNSTCSVCLLPLDVLTLLSQVLLTQKALCIKSRHEDCLVCLD